MSQSKSYAKYQLKDIDIDKVIGQTREFCKVIKEDFGLEDLSIEEVYPSEIYCFIRSYEIKCSPREISTSDKVEYIGCKRDCTLLSAIIGSAYLTAIQYHKKTIVKSISRF